MVKLGGALKRSVVTGRRGKGERSRQRTGDLQDRQAILYGTVMYTCCYALFKTRRRYNANSEPMRLCYTRVTIFLLTLPIIKFLKVALKIMLNHHSVNPFYQFYFLRIKKNFWSLLSLLAKIKCCICSYQFKKFFGDISKKSLPNLASQDLFPTFYSGNFMVLGFTFRSV